jgi:hypothetical protein
VNGIIWLIFPSVSENKESTALVLPGSYIFMYTLGIASFLVVFKLALNVTSVSCEIATWGNSKMQKQKQIKVNLFITQYGWLIKANFARINAEINYLCLTTLKCDEMNYL